MGSWTTGALGVAGLAGDLAGTVGNLVLGAQANNINDKLANTQLAILQANLQLQQQALQQSLDWNNPGKRVEMALQAGFDPISARQIAGAGFVHMQGGVAMGPVRAVEAANLRATNLAHQGLVAGQAFTHGVGRAARPSDFYTAAHMHQAGQDVFTGGGWTPPSSSWRGSVASLSTASTALAPHTWGSTSTPSSVASVPSWARFTPPSKQLAIVPGSAAPRRPQLPTAWISAASTIGSSSV